MALVPVSEAAGLTRVDPATLYRDVDSGRLQATRTADGDILLDTGELKRIYGDADSGPDASLSAEQVKIAMLEERTRALERALALEAELRKVKDQVANELRARLADKETVIRTLQNRVMFLETDRPDPIPTLAVDGVEEEAENAAPVTTSDESRQIGDERQLVSGGWWSRLLGRRGGSSLSG
ncbi:MAG TPA: hypothetical protein VM406_06335 [Noviherbaspirillum sp.]|nr:hypothetical protein [Noviherbaspirillum sp.]